jgi:hypothetical protein
VKAYLDSFCFRHPLPPMLGFVAGMYA